MKFKFLDSEFAYDGSQLCSLFAYRKHNLLGDSLLSWVGPCDVKKEFMVDGEDLNAGEQICGDKMLHFVVEKFDTSLITAVSLQRLMSAMAVEVLREIAEDQEKAQALSRDGDDIYWNDKKLSISIATVSPVSALIHFALNIVNEGTPVATLSLQDLKVNPTQFVETFSSQFINEMTTIDEATKKVHWVK